MNPYEVLGVSPDADEETVKKAYKELVKKYHPDKYINNPLADLAAEKMKEINQAYDMIINKSNTNNRTAYNTNTTGGYGGFGNYANQKPTFSMVRQLIGMNMCSQALMMLQSLPKTAEWYYLSGLANVKCGRYTDGLKFMEQAVRMEPQNQEYADTLNSMKARASSYNTGGGYGTGGTDCCPLPCYCVPCFCCDPCNGPCC